MPKIKEIILHIKGSIKNIMRNIKHHLLLDWSTRVFWFWEVHQQLLDQKVIHKFSPQYGHCTALLSSALLHFGQSL